MPEYLSTSELRDMMDILARAIDAHATLARMLKDFDADSRKRADQRIYKIRACIEEIEAEIGTRLALAPSCAQYIRSHNQKKFDEEIDDLR